MLNFTRLNFDFNALKTITGVFNVRVRWSSYKRRSGPTQCSNCQIFGHGNNNCNLPTVCSLCGEGHHQTECIHLGPYEEGIYAAIKCSNCNGNHAANSLQCPRREEFRSMRETLSRKANNHLRRAANHINHEDHNAYPELSQPRHPSPYYDWNNHRKQPAPTPQTIPPGFKQPSPPPPPPPSSSQVQVQPSQSQTNLPPAHHSTRSYNQHQNNPQQQQRKQQQANQDNSFFSPQELLQITHEIVASLQDCKNKYEQFNAIAGIAIKYLNYNCNV